MYLDEVSIIDNSGGTVLTLYGVRGDSAGAMSLVYNLKAEGRGSQR